MEEARVPRIRLTLRAVSPFFESLVAELVRNGDDLVVDGRAGATETKWTEPRSQDAEVLLVGASVTDGQIDSELRRHPWLTVLRFEEGGHRITIHHIERLWRTEYNAGPQQLLEVIRAAVRLGAIA
jgi:putative AlgH/UPF0301 family transcriptional regulator